MAALALAEGLADRGHRVQLIGLPGSAARGCELRIAAQGTPIFRPGDEAAIARSAPSGDPFAEIFAALEATPLDVLHLHLLDPEALLAADRLAARRPEVRVIATLHLAALFPATVAAVSQLKQVTLTAPSAFAAASWRDDVRVVSNGVETSRIAFAPQIAEPKKLAWAGRRSAEKGLAAAASIAARAGLPLIVAGAEAPEGGALALEGELEDLGVLPRAQVPERVFARAAATLVTSSIAESFSLVAAESLAAGTPVVAFDRGALREVIEDGVTGVLVESGDLDAAAAACRAIAAGQLSIDRKVCRADAVARFEHARTLDAFEQLYRATTLPADLSR